MDRTVDGGRDKHVAPGKIDLSSTFGRNFFGWTRLSCPVSLGHVASLVFRHRKILGVCWVGGMG